MAKASFFAERADQSVVKAAIVSKYFWAWANVMLPTARRFGKKIAYLDLFAGPGRYADGAKSTPLMILEQVIAHAEMPQMFVSMFNDMDKDNVQSLQNSINALPGIDKLKYPPEVLNDEVGTEMVKEFEAMKLVPTLFFVDPWGYKGLSLRLVNAVVKDWGCECVFFFNYNRVSMGLGNAMVKTHMDALFGEDAAAELRKEIEGIEPEDRELAIVEALSEALNPTGERFVLPFRFRNAQGTRTSHHLIFVSKAFKGYEIMKEIMAKESSTHEQGVPSFEYSPADARFPVLFGLARPLDDLQDMLVKDFAGQTLAMSTIYEKHNVGTRYIKSNYKESLKALETAGRIKCDPPAKDRPKNTCADRVRVTFPRTPSGK